MHFILSMMTTLLFSNLVSAQELKIMERWEGFSTPEILASGFRHDLKALPLEGGMVVGPRGWSSDFWASKKGGINIRWNTPKKEGFDYESPTRGRASIMSIAELSTLAATEKYDLFVGRYDYPLKREADGTASRFASDWAGICNGWAQAAIYHNEPTPKVMTNPDGIKIPFGSSDIKALLSYYYAFYHESETSQMGLRCFFGSWMGGMRGCADDLNAGAFHIVIANKLGLRKEGFMVDVDRYREVWNQPALSYKTKVLVSDLPPSRFSASGTNHEIRVETEFFYADESDPTWNTQIGTENQKISKLDLQYRLEIDGYGNIIGGEWESAIRPDFIWDKHPVKPKEFHGLLSDLHKLLND